MSTRRRQPIYTDDEALELIDRLLGDWVDAANEHLTEKQKSKKWWAREKAKQAEAIATARDGNYRPLIRGWREERWTLSEEAKQLIADKAIGVAKRSHRHGPAHGKNSPHYKVAKWVPAIKEILRVFYLDIVSERDRLKFAVALAAKLYDTDVQRFRNFWEKKYKKGSPSSLIDYLLCYPKTNDDPNMHLSPPSTTAELNRFRKYLVLERKVYLSPEHIKESRKIFPRLFAE